MAFNIAGKVALITGGATAIGLACVKELLKKGLKGVTIVDINKKSGEESVAEVTKEFGPDKAIYFDADISNKKSFQAAFDCTVKAFDNIDILINNAGVMNDAHWDQEIAVNVCGTTTGTLLAINEYIRKYSTCGEGVIVNMSSIAGIEAEYSIPIYSATKYYILGLSKAFGHEDVYKKTCIKVLTLCPGATESNMIRSRKDRHIGAEEEARFDKVIESSQVQDAKCVGLAAVKIITCAKSGTVWISISSKEAYEVTGFPKVIP